MHKPGEKWRGVDALQNLKENGLEWVRVGVLTTSSQDLRDTPVSEWNTHPWRNEYLYSLEYAEQLLREAANKGLRLNLVFSLSDMITHGALSAWRGLSLTETARILEDYTYNTTRHFADRGLNIELYDIGSEIGFGLLQFKLGEGVTSPPGVSVTTNMDYMKNNVWSKEAILLKSAVSGVRRANPDAKIVLPIFGLGISPGDVFIKSFFQTMVDQDVQFDYAGLLHPYPSATWPLPDYSARGWFQRLQATVNFLASLDKKVIFSFTAYPHNATNIEGEPMEDFPFTPTGQAAWVRDQLLFASNNDNVIGFFYLYALDHPSSGLFQSANQVMPAMKEFRVNLPP